MIDEVDDCSPSGLRLLRAQTAGANRNACLSLIENRDLGGLESQPGRARSAGRDRQLVRAPPGSGTAPGWRSRRWSRASRSTTATRRRAPRCCVHPDEGNRSRSSSSAGTQRSCAPPPLPCAARGADMIDLNMGCPVPKVCKTGAGAALLEDPDTAVAVPAPRRGLGLPVTVKLRSGQRPATPTASSSPTAWSTRPASRDRLPPARPPYHKGSPDYDLAAELVDDARRAGDPLRRPARRPADPRRLRSTGAAAVMLARGALGNPWLFAGSSASARRGPRRRGPGRAPLGHGPGRRALGQAARGAACAGSTPGPSTAWTGAGA